MKRILGITVVVMLVTFVLTGCNRQSSSGTSKTAATAAPVEIKLKYWGAEQDAIMQEIQNGFNKANPSVQVTMFQEPMDQYWTKWFASIAANDPTVDIAWINPTYAAQMMGVGQLEDITDLYNSGKVDKSKFTAAAVGSYTWEGKIYAVPKDFQTVCLIYNKSIFDEVGIPYPTNDWKWDDLLKASQAIVKKDAAGNITRYGYVHNSSAMSSWFVYVYANGGELFNPDAHNGNYVNIPENVQAWQWATDLVHKYHVAPDGKVTSEMNVDVLFINEMTAMTCYVPSQLETYANALGGEKLGVAYFPYNTKRATITNCLGWGMSKGVKNLDAAKAVMTYLGSREGQEPQKSMIIPAYLGIVSAMEEKFSAMNFKAYIDSGAFAVPTPVEKYVGNAARVALETEINYLMFGEKNAAQALADAEANIRKIVAEEKTRRGIN